MIASWSDTDFQQQSCESCEYEVLLPPVECCRSSFLFSPCTLHHSWRPVGHTYSTVTVISMYPDPSIVAWSCHISRCLHLCRYLTCSRNSAVVWWGYVASFAFTSMWTSSSRDLLSTYAVSKCMSSSCASKSFRTSEVSFCHTLLPCFPQLPLCSLSILSMLMGHRAPRARSLHFVRDYPILISLCLPGEGWDTVFLPRHFCFFCSTRQELVVRWCLRLWSFHIQLHILKWLSR